MCQCAWSNRQRGFNGRACNGVGAVLRLATVGIKSPVILEQTRQPPQNKNHLEKGQSELSWASELSLVLCRPFSFGAKSNTSTVSPQKLQGFKFVQVVSSSGVLVLGRFAVVCYCLPLRCGSLQPHSHETIEIAEGKFICGCYDSQNHDFRISKVGRRAHVR